MVCLVVTNNAVYYGRSVRMASKGIMFSNRVAGERVRVRVTVAVGEPAKVHRVWVWRPEQSGLSGSAGRLWGAFWRDCQRLGKRGLSAERLAGGG